MDVESQITKITGAVKFGVSYLGKETPIWATNIFRVFYFLIKIATAWIAGTHLIADSDKVEIGLFLNVVVDGIVWLITHMFGIKVDDLDQYATTLKTVTPGGTITTTIPQDSTLNESPVQAQAL